MPDENPYNKLRQSEAGRNAWYLNKLEDLQKKSKLFFSDMDETEWLKTIKNITSDDAAEFTKKFEACEGEHRRKYIAEYGTLVGKENLAAEMENEESHQQLLEMFTRLGIVAAAHELNQELNELATYSTKHARGQWSMILSNSAMRKTLLKAGEKGVEQLEETRQAGNENVIISVNIQNNFSMLDASIYCALKQIHYERGYYTIDGYRSDFYERDLLELIYNSKKPRRGKNSIDIMQRVFSLCEKTGAVTWVNEAGKTDGREGKLFYIIKKPDSVQGHGEQMKYSIEACLENLTCTLFTNQEISVPKNIYWPKQKRGTTTDGVPKWVKMSMTDARVELRHAIYVGVFSSRYNAFNARPSRQYISFDYLEKNCESVTFKNANSRRTHVNSINLIMEWLVHCNIIAGWSISDEKKEKIVWWFPKKGLKK
jgi:hypothetical protein